MAAQPRIRINTDARIQRESISEDQNCVIVDDFLRDPHVLVEIAAHQADAFSMPVYHYPGLLLGLDDNVMTDIYGFIRSEMTNHFPFRKSGINLSTFLSMVTLQPDELSNLQRICHSDPKTVPDVANYAALVYLFDNQDLGGTGFYRWRDRELVEQATALELEDPVRGLEFLQENFATFRKPAHYMSESNEIAECLCTIPAKFNRMIFYSGDIPHSAAISAPELLSTDFQKGRLTLNCFASVVPR